MRGSGREVRVLAERRVAMGPGFRHRTAINRWAVEAVRFVSELESKANKHPQTARQAQAPAVQANALIIWGI